MSLPDVWLSAPAVRLPPKVVRNDEMLDRVRARFRGSDAEWDRVDRRIRSLFRACGTDVRYLEDDAPRPLGGHAAAAAADLLATHGLDPAALDAVVYGSIAREYYEPATACEVAANLGADSALAYDVTAACAGSVLAVQELVGRAAVDDSLRNALVVTATMTAGHVQYDIPDAASVDLLGAGLTLGNASTAMLLSREPGPGRARVVAMHAESMSRHHALCRAPIDGHFVTDGPAIFALVRHLPAHLRTTCERAGWRPDEVDFFICHQPSNAVLRTLAAGLEIPRENLPTLHGLYGNCAASAVPVAWDHLRRAGALQPGAKLMLATAASGFIMASVAVVWEG